MAVGRHLAVFGLYAAASVVFLWSAWQRFDTGWAGVAGDPGQVSWFLAWTPHALAHGESPFFTTHLNYPDGVNLAWNTTMPVLGLLTWPVTATLRPIASYNLLLTLAFATSAWCAYFAVRRYVPWWPAAFAAGLFYGFSPYMTAQAWGHLNLVWMAMPPLLFLLLDECFVRQKRSPRLIGLLLGALLGVQFLVTEEVVASVAIASVVGLTVLALLNRDRVGDRIPYVLRAALVALPVFLLFVAWPLYVQFFGDQRVHGHVNEGDVYVTDLANLVVPTRALQLAPAVAIELSDRFTGNVSEWGGYLGLSLIAVVLGLVVLRRRDRLVRFAALTAGVLLLLSLGEHVHLGGDVTPIPGPWWFIGRVPLVGNILPARLMTYADFFLALLLALAMAQVARQPGRGRATLAVAVGLVCLLPILPRTPFPTSTPVVPAFFAGGGYRVLPEGSNVLVAPFSGPICPSDGPAGASCAALDPMYWQALAGFRYRMPGGYYIGPGPDGRRFWLGTESETSVALRAIADGYPPASIGPATRQALLDQWREWQLDAVLVGPMPHQQAMVDFLASLLGRPPDLIDGVYLWRDLPSALRPVP